MYGKFFAQAFIGSMYGAGENVFSVWTYAIANADKTGSVELNPKMLSDVIGSTPERMVAAIEWLCRPDPESRCKENGGRRLVPNGQYQYLMPSYPIYRDIKSQEARRLSNARSQRAWRERQPLKPLKGERRYVKRMKDGAPTQELDSISAPVVSLASVPVSDESHPPILQASGGLDLNGKDECPL